MEIWWLVLIAAVVVMVTLPLLVLISWRVSCQLDVLIARGQSADASVDL